VPSAGPLYEMRLPYLRILYIEIVPNEAKIFGAQRSTTLLVIIVMLVDNA
jgi:hypothetical protein